MVPPHFQKPTTLEVWREFPRLTSGGRLRQGEAYVTKNQREEVMKTRNKTSTNRLKVDLHSNEDSQLILIQMIQLQGAKFQSPK